MMHRLPTWFVALLGILAASVAASAADPGSLELPVALFVTAPPAGYGMYESRPSKHFRSGEPLYIYIEPKDFQYGHIGNIVTFGISADIIPDKKQRRAHNKEQFSRCAVQKSS